MPQPLTRARHGAAPLALALCLLCLSACGSSSSTSSPPPSPAAAPAAHSSSTASTAAPASTTSTTTATATATAPAATTTTTATTAEGGTCQPAQLRASAGAGGAAMQQYGQRIVLTNTSSSTCTLYGYPGVALVDSSGHALETAVHHGPGYTFTDPGPSLVHLGPGASASFSFGGADASQPQGTPCPAAAAVNVIPPNDYTAITVSVRAAACPGGTLDVSAVAPGSS